jgi:hypothetical protein
MGRLSAHGFVLPALPSWESGLQNGDGVRTPGMLTARPPRPVHVRDDAVALVGGRVAAGQRQGFPLEHEGSSRVAPDKVVEGGAHLRVGSTVREGWRRRLNDVPRKRWSPVAGGSGGELLQLVEGKGKMRRVSNERKMVAWAELSRRMSGRRLCGQFLAGSRELR